MEKVLLFIIPIIFLALILSFVNSDIYYIETTGEDVTELFEAREAGEGAGDLKCVKL